ncbi:LysR substrate-binding domain-containing protein [Pseudoduganella sp. UC29_106]|uniref:LysR substrate-binding domain-containing protein n=1 Tax=Pseudoduganella sp. UC29_106 TaxID=3374553 RepID=UPI0037579E38
MASRTNLDMDVLRTFATAFELGSFARAADRLGRSQSAVSTQLRRLEEQVGQDLVQKSGRGLVLTTAGEAMFSYAKRILDLNDEAVETVRGGEVEGWVRFGMPQDFAETWLPAVLARFTRAHPKVRVEVRAERNAHLGEQMRKGELDLALGWGSGEIAPNAVKVAELPIVWVGRPDWRLAPGEKLPLLAFDQPCEFRSAGIAALDAAGIPWQLVFVSASLAGLYAAAEAGLGITLRTAFGMPKSLQALDPATYGLPALPRVSLSLHRAGSDANPAVRRLSEILLDTLAEALGPTAT